METNNLDVVPDEIRLNDLGMIAGHGGIIVEKTIGTFEALPGASQAVNEFKWSNAFKWTGLSLVSAALSVGSIYVLLSSSGSAFISLTMMAVMLFTGLGTIAFIGHAIMEALNCLFPAGVNLGAYPHLNRKSIRDIKSPRNMSKSIEYSFQAHSYLPGEITTPLKEEVIAIGEASTRHTLLSEDIDNMLSLEAAPYTIQHTVSLVGKGYQVEQVVIENPSHAWDNNMNALENLT